MKIEVKIMPKEEYKELKTKAKIIDLMKNHKVSILKNGYVIDDVYYEEIDYYKEEKEVK